MGVKSTRFSVEKRRMEPGTRQTGNSFVEQEQLTLSIIGLSAGVILVLGSSFLRQYFLSLTFLKLRMYVS